MNKVLFVDDLSEMFEMTKVFFRQEIKNQEYEFIYAENGQEALEKIKKLSDSLDLLIIDIPMPIINGNILIEKLIEQKIFIKTIVTSGYPDRVRETQKIIKNNERWFSFLAKPFNFTEELKPLIQNVIRAPIQEELLDGKDLKFQQLSKLINQLPKDKKERIVNKFFPYLDYDSMLELGKSIEQKLPEAKHRKALKLLIEDKIKAKKVSLDIDLDSVEMLRIEAKETKRGDRYYYLRGRLNGEHLNTYLGTDDVFAEHLDLINTPIK